MTSQSGHTEYLDDLNTCTPSVFIQNDIFAGILYPSCVLYISHHHKCQRVFHHVKTVIAMPSKWMDLIIICHLNYMHYKAINLPSMIILICSPRSHIPKCSKSALHSLGHSSLSSPNIRW